jgi:ribonuclease P protein component
MPTFKKEERLKSKKIIGRLFNKEGQSTAKFPLRIIYLYTDLNTDYPAQFTVSVSKRHFKNAVDRNRIKRQIREAYRLNKESVYQSLQAQNRQCAIMILFTGREAIPYREIEKKVKRLLKNVGM